MVGCLVFTVVVGTAGCKEDRYLPASDKQSIRVVSLSPALTQMMVDLKAADLIVGVADNDPAAPTRTPSMGPFPNFDSEALLSAQPTHVVMTYQGTVPEHLRELAMRHDFQLFGYVYPENIAAIGGILFSNSLHPPCLAMVINRSEQGRALFLDFYKELDEIGQVIGRPRPRPRVLMLLGTDPPMAIGPKTVLGDLLWLMLKADNAVADAESDAPILDKEMIVKAAPDVVLFLTPDRPPLGSVHRDPRLAIFRDMDIPAVKADRIFLIDERLVLLPSTSLVRVAIAMAKAIYPDHAEAIDLLPTTSPTELANVLSDTVASTAVEAQ